MEMEEVMVSAEPEEVPVQVTSTGLKLTPERIESYLGALEKAGCVPETVKAYRLKLIKLYRTLPEEKRILPGTLEEWRQSLLEGGYTHSTVNNYTTAANGLVTFFGHKELQVERPLEWERGVRPELTRNEYLRLLSAARNLEKEREYLLVKVFATTGLALTDLPKLTVEAIEAGKIRLQSTVLRLPDCLREELEEFVRRQGYRSGPIFRTRNGLPIERTNITRMVQSLSYAAQVDEEKATPRCLRRLYQTTLAGIRTNISLLVDQAHERLLEEEQLAVGWQWGSLLEA